MIRPERPEHVSKKLGGSKETWVWTMAMAMDSGHVIGIVLVTNVTI